MKEDFLHYVWTFKLFNTTNLKTSYHDEVKIIKSGQHNLDAGPDFFNAQIKINNTLWVGNIEIHKKSSDWNKHKHQFDKAYDNVIMHVVYENDVQVLNSKKLPIPTIELKPIIFENILENYKNLKLSKKWISCSTQIISIDDFTINLWLERLAYERLERKSEDIKEIYKENTSDWESTFYQLLLKYFGLKVNVLPFELLARNTPIKLLEKHRHIRSIEALLFGQSGFLQEEINDNKYYLDLRKEYTFLKKKFQLSPIDNTLWKFLRLRPYNFPTIRIAQIAQLLLINPRMFNQIIETDKLESIRKLFDVSASSYWDSHFNFNTISKKKNNKKIGTQTANSLIINVVIPIVFVYGKSVNNEEIVTKSLRWLEELSAERNTIIKKWKEEGVKPINAMQSQALLELKNNYCSEKKCLNCSIGNELIKQSST